MHDENEPYSLTEEAPEGAMKEFNFERDPYYINYRYDHPITLIAGTVRGHRPVQGEIPAYPEFCIIAKSNIREGPCVETGLSNPSFSVSRAGCIHFLQGLKVMSREQWQEHHRYRYREEESQGDANDDCVVYGGKHEYTEKWWNKVSMLSITI